MTRMLVAHVMGSVALLHVVNAIRSDTAVTDASRAAQVLQSNSFEQRREKQRWKACKWMGFTTYKQYHFQFTVDGRPTAVLLERHKWNPEIRLWDGAAWRLNLYKSELEWQRALSDGSESHVKPRLIPLMEASYVRYVSGSAQEKTPSLIMIGQRSGDPLVLSGGSYFNDELMKLALRRHSQQKRREGVIAGTGSLVNAPDRAGAERAAGKLWSHSTFGATSGSVVGAASGAGLASLPLVMVGSTPGALASAIISGAAQGGAVLGAAGAAFGVATGLVSGLTAGAAKYVKLKREARLGMPEKIFEKLKCHWQFKKCMDDVLVHKGTPCPQEAPGSDFLAKMPAAAAEASAS